VLAVVVLGLAGLGTAAASEGDVTIAIAEDGNTSVTDPDGLVTGEDQDAPDRYAWALNLTEEYHVAHVEIDRGFPIEEGRQLVPLVDGDHFIQTPSVTDVDRAADVFRLNEIDDGWRYDLGLNGTGEDGAREAELTLTRDLTSPTIEIVSVGNRTDIGFDVTTNTSEIARTELFVRSTEGEIIQTYPARPGPWQQFPVQGLDANTTYEVVVDAADWSGNNATSETITVTTAESTEPPEPLVEAVTPAPNGTVPANSVLIEASYDERGWPIVEEDVRLFFDKERVDRSDFEVGDGTITYRPEGTLDPRKYSVSIEVPNTAGGTGIARWTFHAESQTANASPGPLGLASIALATGLWVAIRRRR
jgi:hypothetical protein